MVVQIKIDGILHRLWLRKVPFFIVFFIAVLLTLTILTIIDFIPEPPNSDPVSEVEETEEATAVVESENVAIEPIIVDPLPQKIIFDQLDREVAVLNPESREIPDLDAALLDGAVRHPDSASFEEDGNMFILAHSSYLPNVFNKNYQAFNGIQELEWGDTVRVQSGDTEYVYFIEEVYKASASEVIVPHTPGEPRLTLATCNSFGSKDDRFIVEAKLVEQKAL